MDISDQKVVEKYCFAVIDDCSRKCLGLFEINKISTEIIIKLLDDLIKIHGKPREILTDNGSVFGLRSKHSKFDRWCRRRGINIFEQQFVLRRQLENRKILSDIRKRIKIL